PPAPTAVYPTMTRPGSPDPRSAPRPGSGYDGGRSAGRPANWEGGYGQQAASAVNGHGAMNGHPAVNGSAADGGTGPNSYRPAAAPSGYQGYPEQPSTTPSGNPYGSYVSDPADSYQASRPNGDGGYGSYVSNAETQAYAQPSAIQPSAPQPAAAQPVHAAPVYENGTGYPAQGGGAAGYGASWPGGSGYSGQAQPGYQGGAPGQPGYAPSQPGYAAGHNGNGHNGAGHNGNGHNGNATGPYDQSSYPPPDGSGAAPTRAATVARTRAMARAATAVTLATRQPE